MLWLPRTVSPRSLVPAGVSGGSRISNMELLCRDLNTVHSRRVWIAGAWIDSEAILGVPAMSGLRNWRGIERELG